MHFYVREVGRPHPFHNLPYHYERDAQNRADELNRLEARKEDGTKYEVVTSLQLSIEEDRAFKYQDADEY
jgi:hypothetical protein